MSSNKIQRAPISNERKAMIWANAKYLQTNDEGRFVSPNTGAIIPEGTKLDLGHRPGFENRTERSFSEAAGLSQAEHNAMFTNPGQFQIEPRYENQGHTYENPDSNDAMQNVMAYAVSNSPEIAIAANTYINPSDDHCSGSISIVSKDDGMETTLCEYCMGADAAENNNGNTASENDGIGE